MARSTLKYYCLVLAILAIIETPSLSSAQTSAQTGLLYWCSMIEGGSNFAWQNIATNQPRTTWQVR
jgi:hypothetical protein